MAALGLVAVEVRVAAEVDDVVAATPEPAAHVGDRHALAGANRLRIDFDVVGLVRKGLQNLLDRHRFAAGEPERGHRRPLLIQPRVADDEHAQTLAIGTADRAAPGGDGHVEEHLPGERVPRAQPLVAVAHELPGIVEQRPRQLELDVQRLTGRRPLRLERLGQVPDDVLAQQVPELVELQGHGLEGAGGGRLLELADHLRDHRAIEAASLFVNHGVAAAGRQTRDIDVLIGRGMAIPRPPRRRHEIAPGLDFQSERHHGAPASARGTDRRR